MGKEKEREEKEMITLIIITIISAKLNRKCRTMEYDPRYCDVIIKRWETLTGKKAEVLE